MLHALKELGDNLNGIGVLITLFMAAVSMPSIVIFYFQIWRSRKKFKLKVRQIFFNLSSYIVSWISINYRIRYKQMRIKQLTDELKELVGYRRRHELESFSKTFYRLASAVINFSLLCLYLAFTGFLVFLWVSTVLEHEILKVPVHSVHLSGIQKFMLYANVMIPGLLFSAFLWNIGEAQREARKLSSSLRNKKIDGIKKKLTGYGVDVNELMKQIKPHKAFAHLTVQPHQIKPNATFIK